MRIKKIGVNIFLFQFGKYIHPLDQKLVSSPGIKIISNISLDNFLQ